MPCAKDAEVMGSQQRKVLAELLLLAALVFNTAPRCKCRYQDAPRAEGRVAIDKSVDPHWELPAYRVNPNADLLSILVAIYPSDTELGFLQNQLRTFAHFFATHSIKDYFLVAPRAHLPKLQAFTHQVTSDLGLPDGLLRAVPEDKCCSLFHPKHPYMGRRKNGQPVFGGWVKQQIVKLACANLVQTPFYLVMDADIIFATTRTASEFFHESDCKQGSPVCDTSGRTAFQSKNDAYPLFNRSEEQKTWMRNTAATLQLSVPIDWRFAQGVTPQILSKDVSIQAGHWIQLRFQVENWVSFLLEAILNDKTNYWEEEKKPGGKKWHPLWTEFCFYWIFATHSDSWDDFHSVAKPTLLAVTVWERAEFHSWHPCNATHSAFEMAVSDFGLVQSASGIAANNVWSKIQLCLRADNKYAVKLKPHHRN